MRVAVVGGGPAGALTSFLLARDGVDVNLFDASHPREKPCGGGLTTRALALLPDAPAGDPVPVRRVPRCRLEADTTDGVEVELPETVAIAARRELDAWLVRRAVEAGARHVAEHVVDVSAGQVSTREQPDRRFDFVVGADGADSRVRRCLGTPIPAARRAIAVGWYSPGTAPMLVRFLPDAAGYLWLFPRRDHVGVGACAPLGPGAGAALFDRLEHEVARSFPALLDVGGERYAATIPSPSTDPACFAEAAGPGWALVGDAAALADPITGEGIYPALHSASLLARTLAAGESSQQYARRLAEELGPELLRSAAVRERFFGHRFLRTMLLFARLSPAVHDVLADLVCGRQGYVGLRRRLLRAAPRLVWQAGRSLAGG